MNDMQVNPDLDEVYLLKNVFTQSWSLLETGIILELFWSGNIG
jgi:hypothetical protein